MGMSANDVHSWGVSVLRGGRGLLVRWPGAREPEQPLELYDFEACPFCRKVREVLSELDLSYVWHPAAHGSRNRERVRSLGGKVQFPFLVDPGAGRTLYESEDIIDHLLGTYGPGRGKAGRLLAPINTAASAIASMARRRGGRVRPAAESRAQPAQRLVLYNFEASPYCRKVREVICELDLQCEVINVAKKGRRRPELVARGGKMQVPFLVDPNTGTELYESADIVAYLERTYGGPPRG